MSLFLPKLGFKKRPPARFGNAGNNNSRRQSKPSRQQDTNSFSSDNIRKFYRAKNCVSLRFCKFTKVYGIIFRKISKYYISLQFRKIYVILRSKYYASFQYRKIYAILRSKYSANLRNCKPA